MAFNAGGTNVGGVAYIEQGTLKSASDTKSITADGNYTQSFTVPVGEKWILKAGQMFKSTGTYTVSTCQFRIDALADGNLVTINTGTGSLFYFLPQPLTLEAGAIIYLNSNMTGYSITGDFTSRILYQKIII